LHFIFKPASWTDLYNIVEFSFGEMITLNFILNAIYICGISLFFIIAIIYKKKLGTLGRIIRKEEYSKILSHYIKI